MDTQDLSRRDIVRISGAMAITATVGVNSVSAQQSSTKNPTVYISAQDQFAGWAVYAVDASTGQQDWIFTEPKSTTTSPVAVNGSLYFGTSDGNLFSLNASSGEKQWSFTEAAGGIVSSPTVTN
jgi:outer membrane protein assembly factor BamB